MNQFILNIYSSENHQSRFQVLSFCPKIGSYVVNLFVNLTCRCERHIAFSLRQKQ